MRGFFNLRQANSKRTRTSHFSGSFFFKKSVSRHTVHHFYEHGCVEDMGEEVTNDSVFTYGHPARPFVPDTLNSEGEYSECMSIQNPGCGLISVHVGTIPLDYIRKYIEIMLLFW